MRQLARIHVIFSGSVQGVGFRFVSERIAVRLNLTGFVKNLLDGTVEVVCEGNKSELEVFLKKIAETMAGYISDFHVDWEPACNKFTSFEISF
ncbi:MAG: acylphosphatase [Candidatus Omnitrophica bacterium]|nr:acylphosphatase [Candidatus Omnitrophota bacterium]